MKAHFTVALDNYKFFHFAKQNTQLIAVMNSRESPAAIGPTPVIVYKFLASGSSDECIMKLH
jgi:hypothetical protein